MCFNFHGVHISQICNFYSFNPFKFAVRYSGVEIFAGEIFMDIQSESVYHNSIRQLQRCKTCWTLFSAAYPAILAFWVTVMVLSYCSLFIYPMATNPLCSAAATHVVLSTSFCTAFVIEGGTIFSKSGTIPSKDE